MENIAIELSEKGKKAFEEGDFASAIHFFSETVKHYSSAENFLDAAEAKNNLSVALLQENKAKEALEAVEGTDIIFAEAKDRTKEAMAYGNQAAALEALGKKEEALNLYRKSANLFGEIGEGDYQEIVLKSIAALELKGGKLQDTAATMLQSLSATEKPSLFQRFLRFILRIVR